MIDPHLKWQLRSKLKELHRALDLTMIYVTHDQTEALTFADKVVVMHEGSVVQTGTPEELFERPAHTFVGYFIGSPGMNVLPAEVQGRPGAGRRPCARARRDATASCRPARASSSASARSSCASPRAGAGPAAGRGRAHRRSRPHPLRPACALGDLRMAAQVPNGQRRRRGRRRVWSFDPAQIHVYADSRRVEGTA